ncbi:aluminum-activated malate transporter 1-like [Canna indica]|uniref:Aluminum-activated malate transporter 1-like n=1 Tax=Canna indica TaxID=4628 RepID=A0AAQ3KV42_9LILI|nr:aluminum-activated malate transporter 1-like [Canna indica]
MEFGCGLSGDDKINGWWLLCSPFLDKLRRRVVGFAKEAKKMAREDPRRIAHSFKVGLALTLVSIFYYVKPLFHGCGLSTMWAVLTVVVVMEYTVGATLSKGLNRAFATLVAGALGVAAHQIAVLCGDKGEPVLLAFFVFILAAAASFSRFIPEIKARYDYGVTIFILTFSLVAVSSYRVEELIQLAHQRLATIAIGVAICLCTSIFLFPVWAGQDLHNLVAENLEKLASFFDGFAAEYFADHQRGETSANWEGKPFLQVYKSVLNSKSKEESLANFARWEPSHGRFLFRHPWEHYLKIGALSRRCASSMDALSTCIAAPPSKSKPCADPDLQLKIRTACKEISSESAKALKEISSAIRSMTFPCSANGHLSAAMAKLTKEMQAADDSDLSGILHVATTASLLAELVNRTHEVVDSVDNLARLARFKRPEPIRVGKV